MTKGEQVRLTAWRWKVLQEATATQNVARVCRRFGISRKSFYKWKRGTSSTAMRACAIAQGLRYGPPRATSPDVVSKIFYLREQYHFGPARIAAYLQRFHQITIGRSSVHRILQRRGMNRLPVSQKHQRHGKRWQRYEKPLPGHGLQGM